MRPVTKKRPSAAPWLLAIQRTNAYEDFKLYFVKNLIDNYEFCLASSASTIIVSAIIVAYIYCEYTGYNNNVDKLVAIYMCCHYCRPVPKPIRADGLASECTHASKQKRSEASSKARWRGRRRAGHPHLGRAPCRPWPLPLHDEFDRGLRRQLLRRKLDRAAQRITGDACVPRFYCVPYKQGLNISK